MADFLPAYKKTGRNEGGWNHVAGDAGGETIYGIARNYHPTWAGWKVVDAWKKEHGRPKHGQKIPVPEELIRDFYKVEFWDRIGGDAIEDQGVAQRLYDFGVNAGYGRSIKQIQEVLDIPQTGKVDAATIAAINNPAKHLIS